MLELVDPALRASKVLRKQHAARDADRYERPQVIVLDRTDGDEEVKEEERQESACRVCEREADASHFRAAAAQHKAHMLRTPKHESHYRYGQEVWPTHGHNPCEHNRNNKGR